MLGGQLSVLSLSFPFAKSTLALSIPIQKFSFSVLSRKSRTSSVANQNYVTTDLPKAIAFKNFVV